MFKIKDWLEGVTLTEVLIVIMAVAILLGMGITQYNKTMENAIKSEAFANLLNMHASETRYFKEHKTYSDRFFRLDTENPNNLILAGRGGRFIYWISHADKAALIVNAWKPNSDYLLRIDAKGKITELPLSGPPAYSPTEKE